MGGFDANAVVMGGGSVLPGIANHPTGKLAQLADGHHQAAA